MKLSHLVISLLALRVVGAKPAYADFNLTREVGDLTIQHIAFYPGAGPLQGGSLFTVAGISLTETVVINTLNNTIRQYGNISLGAFTVPQTTFYSTQSLPPVFPNPPTTVSGELTFGFSASESNFSFDTGFVPMVWNGTQYSFTAGANLSLAIQQSVAVTTGGITYGGDSSSSLSMLLSLGGTVGTANYPTSIELSPAFFRESYTTLYDFTAPNQFHAIARAAINPVPEPSLLALTSCAGLLLLVTRSQRGRSREQLPAQ